MTLFKKKKLVVVLAQSTARGYTRAEKSAVADVSAKCYDLLTLVEGK